MSFGTPFDYTRLLPASRDDGLTHPINGIPAVEGSSCVNAVLYLLRSQLHNKLNLVSNDHDVVVGSVTYDRVEGSPIYYLSSICSDPAINDIPKFKEDLRSLGTFFHRVFSHMLHPVNQVDDSVYSSFLEYLYSCNPSFSNDGLNLLGVYDFLTNIFFGHVFCIRQGIFLQKDEASEPRLLRSVKTHAIKSINISDAQFDDVGSRIMKKKRNPSPIYGLPMCDVISRVFHIKKKTEGRTVIKNTFLCPEAKKFVVSVGGGKRIRKWRIMKFETFDLIMHPFFSTGESCDRPQKLRFSLDAVVGCIPSESRSIGGNFYTCTRISSDNECWIRCQDESVTRLVTDSDDVGISGSIFSYTVRKVRDSSIAQPSQDSPFSSSSEISTRFRHPYSPVHQADLLRSPIGAVFEQSKVARSALLPSSSLSCRSDNIGVIEEYHDLNSPVDMTPKFTLTQPDPRSSLIPTSCGGSSSTPPRVQCISEHLSSRASPKRRQRSMNSVPSGRSSRGGRSHPYLPPRSPQGMSFPFAMYTSTHVLTC